MLLGILPATYFKYFICKVSIYFMNCAWNIWCWVYCVLIKNHVECNI
jgi:hypothetical protein